MPRKRKECECCFEPVERPEGKMCNRCQRVYNRERWIMETEQQMQKVGQRTTGVKSVDDSVHLGWIQVNDYKTKALANKHRDIIVKKYNCRARVRESGGRYYVERTL